MSKFEPTISDHAMLWILNNVARVRTTSDTKATCMPDMTRQDGYLSSAYLALAILLLMCAARYVLPMPDVSDRASNIERLLYARPAVTALMIGAIVPAMEEVIFRGFATASAGPLFSLIGGFCSSLVFGFAHESGAEGLMHTVSGLALWWLAYRRGLTHSIFSHMLNNSVVLACVFISFKTKEFI